MKKIIYSILTRTSLKTRWRHAKGFAVTTTDPIEHISKEKSVLKIFVKICYNFGYFPLLRCNTKLNDSAQFRAISVIIIAV